MTSKPDTICYSHWPDCWSAGPPHYECARREVGRLRAALQSIASFSGCYEDEARRAKSIAYDALSGAVPETPAAPEKTVAVCGIDCHPGDDVCNNYCNMAPEKGPMQRMPRTIPRAASGN